MEPTHQLIVLAGELASGRSTTARRVMDPHRDTVQRLSYGRLAMNWLEAEQMLVIGNYSTITPFPGSDTLGRYVYRDVQNALLTIAQRQPDPVTVLVEGMHATTPETLETAEEAGYLVRVLELRPATATLEERRATISGHPARELADPDLNHQAKEALLNAFPAMLHVMDTAAAVNQVRHCAASLCECNGTQRQRACIICKGLGWN